MKNARLYLCFALFAALFMLTACHSERIEADTAENFVQETAIQLEETVAKRTSSPETIPTETAPDTTAPEMITQAETEAVTEAVIPPELPEGITTNITSPEAAEILREIAEIAAEHDAAVYFTDVKGEYYFGIRENEEYHSASTIKAPYCQYLIAYEKDLTAQILFESANRTSASGILDADSVGQSFTVRELIEYTIRYSDNQAYYLLYSTFGEEEYNSYVTSIGAAGLSLDSGSEWAHVTAKELSLAMIEIYKTGAESDILTEYLRQTTYNAQISAGTEYETAHKYGYNGGTDGYHDTAVVYAPERAYVLTVLTNIDFYAEDDPNALFRDITKLCDELHEVLFLSEK